MTGTNQHSLEMGPQRVWAVHGPHASPLCLTVALLRTWHSALCKPGAAQTWTEDLAQTLYPTGSSCWRDLIRNRLGEPMSKDIVKKSGDLGGKKLRNLVSLWYRKNGRAVWSLVVRMGERVDKKILAGITAFWSPKGCAHALGYPYTEVVRTDFRAFYKPHTDSLTQQRHLLA